MGTARVETAIESAATVNNFRGTRIRLSRRLYSKMKTLRKSKSGQELDERSYIDISVYVEGIGVSIHTLQDPLQLDASKKCATVH